MPTAEQIQSAVERYASAVSSADKAAIMDCYAGNANVQDPYPQPAHEGKEAVGGFWDGVLGMGSPVSFVPRDVVIAGDRGVFAFTITVEMGEGEGKARLGVSGYDVLTIDDEGLIVDQLAYWDPATMRPVS
jgi:ketosteroid isomerase-like protein